MIINRCDRCTKDYHGSLTDVHYPYVTWRKAQMTGTEFNRHFDLCSDCLKKCQELMEQLSKQINAFLGSTPDDF